MEPISRTKAVFGQLVGQGVRPMMCSKSESRGVAGSQEAYSVHQRPIEECLTVAGKGPIGTRWVDTNKGDEVSPEYRSRWFAQDIKRDRRDDFFAATLHLGAKQALFSLEGTEGIGVQGR